LQTGLGKLLDLRPEKRMSSQQPDAALQKNHWQGAIKSIYCRHRRPSCSILGIRTVRCH